MMAISLNFKDALVQCSQGVLNPFWLMDQYLLDSLHLGYLLSHCCSVVPYPTVVEAK